MLFRILLVLTLQNDTFTVFFVLYGMNEWNYYYYYYLEWEHHEIKKTLSGKYLYFLVDTLKKISKSLA